MKKISYLVLVIFFTASPFALTAQNNISDRVAYYPFNGNASDEVGDNDGTVYGATLISDRFGNSNSAYKFDGVNDYIEIANSHLLNYGTEDDFSISFWVKVSESQADVNGNNDIISKWNALNNTGYPYSIRFWSATAPDHIKGKIGGTRFDACGNSPLVSTNCKVPLEQWIHIVFLKNKNVIHLYENGILVNYTQDNTSSTCETKNNLPVLIGKRASNQRHFKGSIDDISFYNRALTDEEIQIIFEENNWSISDEPNNNTDFLSYSFSEQVNPAVIDTTAKTIDIEVKCNTDIANLIAEFSIPEGAIAEVNNIMQKSGETANDFSAPVTYRVINSNSCDYEDWVVNVALESHDDSVINAMTMFKNFSFPEQIKPADINSENHTINVEVSCATDIKNLTAEFYLPDGAVAEINNMVQKSGETVNDFSALVIYRITSSNSCYYKDWVVNVALESHNNSVINAMTMFENFSFPEQIKPADINSENHTINVEVSCATDIKNLTAEFFLPDGAVAEINNMVQKSGETVNDFSALVIYRITSSNSCYYKDWVVNVALESHDDSVINAMTRFENFSFPEQIKPADINSENHTINVEVSCTADIKHLTADYFLPENVSATVDGITQVSGQTINDYSNPVVFNVISKDGCASVQWVVIVSYVNIDITQFIEKIPNVITPNDDQRNDTWILHVNGEQNQFNIKIYNRWGKLIHEQREYDNTWDANDLSSGLYFYHISHDCDLESSLKGWLHVLK